MTDEHAMAEAVEREFGGLDVVVHTAGQMILAPLADFDLDRMHHTNIRGTFVVDQLAARRVRPGGAIVNVSTSVTKTALPTYAAYAASKGAVDAVTLILARELRGRDITVNAVAPGPTATPLFFNGRSEEMVAQVAGANPMGRRGEPEDIAEVAALQAEPGRWVNGQIVYVDGGQVSDTSRAYPEVRSSSRPTGRQRREIMTNTIVITDATRVTGRASTTGGIDELADRQLAPSPKPIVVGSRPCPVAEAAGRAWSEAEIAAEDHLTQAAEASGLDSVG